MTRAEVVSISLTVSLPMEVTQMSRPSHAMPVERPATATASAMRVDAGSTFQTRSPPGSVSHRVPRQAAIPVMP